MAHYLLKDGEIYNEYAPGYFMWILPRQAETHRDYNGLLRPDERAELTVAIAEYYQQHPEMAM